MKFLLYSISLCILLCLQSVLSHDRVTTPPRGWNSYDSFSWTISEDEYLQNAKVLSEQLLPHGYQYAVVDYLWYRNLKGGAHNSRGFDSIDEWGRLLPDPDRFPSSKGGKGFTEIANKVHGMGLKFGIHLMAGLSTQAYDKNTPVLDLKTGQAYQESGRAWNAKDIGIPERACKWMPNGFMGINATTGAGKAFLKSIYDLYLSWGVDFVKLDCVFGEDLDADEITIVSEIFQESNRSIVFSLSPGVKATPEMAMNMSGLINMYRVTGDDWDEWPAVLAHFDVIRDFAAAKLIDAPGLNGQSWPDLDMLPFGWLTDPAVNYGPHRWTRLTQDEQRTQITLWSIGKSPLMFGGDLRKLDDWQYKLITNPTLLEINSFSSNNQEFPHVTSSIGAAKEAPSSVPSLGLTECTDPKANGWSCENYGQALERMCYNWNPEQNYEPFCVYKTGIPMASLNGNSDEHKNKYHLVDINNEHYCLDPFPTRPLKAQEIMNLDPFSPCIFEPTQMWEQKSNGTLVNDQSGKCATVDVVKGPNDGGVRSWIATGGHGTTYVAFFNLHNQTTTISAKIEDLESVLPGRHLIGVKATEIWSGRIIHAIYDTLSAEVAPHGCALFVLNPYGF